MTRTERTYYLVQALYHSSWSYTAPTYSLFLLSRGLDLLEINLVLATYLIVAFFFEVPTGAVADVFGRKASFVLSCLIRASSFLYYAYANSFPEFLLAEAIDAIGTTLATGALDAWAVDGIRAEGDLRPRDKMFARAHILARIPMMMAGLLAAFIGEQNLAWPFYGGCLSFLVTAAVAATQMHRDHPEPRRDRHGAPARWSILSTIKEGMADLRGDATLRQLCGLTLAASFAVLPTWHTWPPRFEALAGHSIRMLGGIVALVNLGAILANLVALRADLHHRQRILAASMALRAATLALAAMATSFTPALIGFLFFDLGFAFSEPIFQNWTSERAAPARRATVLSMRSMSFTLGGSAGLISIGLIARAYGIPTAWLCAAAVLAVTTPFVLRLRDEH